ncbi:DEAD/DEAH box helicase family protein [Flavobacterium sp. LHD-80]|uniref:DEAD/DEAH box helicase family protein n=1 Tax=Flavobacterium sp. LHD-80 TaxID=3071411 RepID=UPI0027E1CA4A|nr:DEAD/DEAH box helicase family protein [Flavobacterium sp. LHD-80]MDQ6471395.1 DEAD/DEAH box helicase family protein [Flavobacterium sp. LHD-80]
MELPNQYFQDFPIEFKEINPSDFPEFEIENNNEKIIIEPNDEGFINDALQPHIALEDKNTVIVNASVGNGKSYSVIQTIKRYYNSDENYLIIVATPFKSLVEQYVNDIHIDAEIPIEQIFNYLELDRDVTSDYTRKKIQVVSVNSLLGNPGEDSLINTNKKRRYLNSLIQKSTEENRKVVFVYDEIHDAIQNFKEEYIFNLWKWRSIIHKNFIISATFNEASKVVIKYLAELTDKKIQIIESRRLAIPEKQSELHLHYNPENRLESTSKVLVGVVDDLLDRNKNIDILCFSKALVKDIIKDVDGIGGKLKNKFGDINECTSSLGSNSMPRNRFNSDKCNIGTNFKTGVSIRKENHAFLIIMPPRSTRVGFKKQYGIFSNGINSVIQAIARQRTQGEIHIVLPRPDEFDFSSLSLSGMSPEQIDSFTLAYKTIQYYGVKETPVKYLKLNSQEAFLRDFYNNVLKRNVLEEIEYIRNLDRSNLARLAYPTYDIFKLEKGEKYLANYFDFFGADISAYLTYSAFTNQFVNCNLVSINYENDIIFEENKIQKGLNDFFETYLNEDYYEVVRENANFSMFYETMRNEIFSNFMIKYKKDNSENLTPIYRYSNKEFEVQLLIFSAFKFYDTSYNRYTIVDGVPVDVDYVRGDYFLDNIKACLHIDLAQSAYPEDVKQKIKFFQLLNYFRNKLIENIIHYSSGTLDFYYLNNRPNGLFDENDVAKFDELQTLATRDSLLNHGVFEFIRGLNINSFYTKLIDDFFEFTAYRLPVTNGGNVRSNVKKITRTKELPSNNENIDLIEPRTYHYEQPDEEYINENYGSQEEYDHYQNRINELLDS